MNSLLEWTNGNLGKGQLLIVAVVLLVFAIVAPAGIIFYSLIKFKKAKYEKAYVTKWLVAVMLVVVTIGLVFDILTFIFYYGANIMPNDYKKAETMDIAFIVIAAVCAIINYAVLFFGNKHIAIGIGEENFTVFGETYLTSKVTNIVLDKDAKIISLHIAVGKRVVKRITFSLTSMCGQCLQNAAPTMKVTIVEGNDKEILVAEQQKRQEEFRQSLTRTASSLGAKSKVSSASSNGASKVSKVSKASTAKEMPVTDEKQVAENQSEETTKN